MCFYSRLEYEYLFSLFREVSGDYKKAAHRGKRQRGDSDELVKLLEKWILIVQGTTLCSIMIKLPIGVTATQVQN